MIIANTGHRPQKIGGFSIPNPIYNKICEKIEEVYTNLKPEKIISGMALGVDTWCAEIAIKLNIPFIAAVPFKGQESMWPKQSQDKYNELLKQASEIVVVSPGSYSPQKMQIRNKWMVDNSDLLLGVWDGTNGGTKNCLDYAKKIEREIHIIRIDKNYNIEKLLV